MKLCLVCNPNDSKLRPGAFSNMYKDMFRALAKRFDCKCYVTGNCHADKIDADLIIFFDPHSCHHVEIEGLENHPAVKMEVFNDLHQVETRGVYKLSGLEVYKLGEEQRAKRLESRGIDHVIMCGKYKFQEIFGKYFGDKTEEMVLYFPFAPTLNKDGSRPLADRKRAVLGNGAIHGSHAGGYDFRGWAYRQPYIDYVEHYALNGKTPCGPNYAPFLATYAGSLALDSFVPVPKYGEIPMAGCVTFAQYFKEYEELGFKDYESCIYVDKDNIEDRVKDFLNDPSKYQSIADTGRKLMEENYTADHFAEFIYNHVANR